MLCSRYLRPPKEQKHGWLYRFLGRCLDAMNKGYEITLCWVMKHHVTTMAASVVVLLATIHMFGLVPKGFIPSEDIGQLLINTEGAQGVSTSRWCSISNSWLRSSPRIQTWSHFSLH